MKMIWLGSVLASLGLSLCAQAAEPACVARSFTCPFTNSKGEAVVMELQTAENTYAEIAVGTAQQITEGLEPKPASCELNGGTISVYVEVPVTKREGGKSLQSRKVEKVRAFDLDWIPGKNSKKWMLISNDPLIPRTRRAVICVETNETVPVANEEKK